MLTLALDPSSTATGLAIFCGTELKNYGTVRRKKGETLYDYAERVAYHGLGGCGKKPDRVGYEINDTPMPRARQASLRKAHEATGRILQALGVEGEPVQADRKKKQQRRTDMVLVYKIKDRISEHAVDAIALGHRVVNEIK